MAENDRGEKLIKLSDRDHVLTVPGRYIGSILPITTNLFMLESDKIVRKEVTYVPSIVKLVKEVLDNAVDEAVRTNFKYANKIKINLSEDGTITIWDNGRGINHDNDGPLLAWANLRAGTNFNKDGNKTIGQNGEGACLTNIFSTYFKGVTSDGEVKTELISVNNMENVEVTSRNNKAQFTEVSFKLDFKRLSVTGLEEVYRKIIEFDIFNFNFIYPEIAFYFNEVRVPNVSLSKYMSMFSDNMEYVSENGITVGVAPSEVEQFYFNVNGNNAFRGGNALDYIVNNVVYKLKDKIKLNLKPQDIKNRLCFVVIYKDMINPRYDDQIKSFCNNTNFSKDINLDNLVYKVYRNKNIIDPIVNFFKAVESMNHAKILEKKERISDEKYLAATKSKDYLLICEGDSAGNAIAHALGRSNLGYYKLKGVPANLLEGKITDSEELLKVYKIIKQEEYKHVVFATDQDLDGFHIRFLLTVFAYKMFPDEINSGRFMFLQTPLMLVKDKKGNIVKYLYRFEETSDTKYTYHYKKGLGSWKVDEIRWVRDNAEIFFKISNIKEEVLNDWGMKSRADVRKVLISKNKFSINFI